MEKDEFGDEEYQGVQYEADFEEDEDESIRVED